MSISFRRNDYLYSYVKTEPYLIEPHTHKYYEIMYFINVNADYIVEGSRYSVKNGDIIITRPNEFHRIEFKDSSCYDRHFLQISSDYLKYMGIDLLHFINTKSSGVLNKIESRHVTKYNLGEYFDKIQYYIVNNLPESEIMIKTYVIQLVVNINNAYKDIILSKNMYLKGNTKIYSIMEYIDSHLTEKLALEDIAESFYINKYHLCHSFKQLTGYTMREYINSHRVAMAKTLLLNGTSASEAAFECGFSDYSTFFKVFKKYTSTSPAEYIKMSKIH